MKKTTKQNNLIEGSAIMNRIIGFIKYHNAFTIGLILVFVFSGAIFASEDLHDAVIGEEITTQTGIDNTQLLTTDLDALDLAMTIDAVSEDQEYFYIDYSFNTLGIKDNTWQPLIKRATMTVSKVALGDKDLGLYVAEELGEVADYELAYLLEVQTAEIEKGQTEIVETTEYTGLVGLVLDIKNKVLPGYESVVELVFDESVQIAQVSQPIDTNDEFLMMDYHSPEPEPELGATPVDPATEIALVPEPELEPVCDLENLNLCTNESECAEVGGYWYDNICNSEPLFEPEPEPEPVIPPDIPPTDTTTPPEDGVEPEPACDSENLDLCADGTECTEAGGYWYDNVCNTEPLPEPEPEPVCDSENLELCMNETDCLSVSGYWYNDVCNTEPEPEPACMPDWSCTEWLPLPETVASGEAFTQTRVCSDLDNCGINEGKPAETQEAIGTYIPPEEPPEEPPAGD